MSQLTRRRCPMERQKIVLSDSFFFFQAEDGIRDLTVTGVQTCALPICQDGTGRSSPGRESADATAASQFSKEDLPGRVLALPADPSRRRTDNRAWDPRDRKSVV